MAWRSWSAVVVLAWVVFYSRPADACWSGWAAQVHRVHLLQGGPDEWDPAVARLAARWSTRIDDLLPADHELMSEHGHVTLTRDGGRVVVGEGDWDGVHFDQLFLVDSQILHPRAPITAASTDGASVPAALTVQVFASTSRDAAERFARAVDAKALRLTRPIGLDATFYVAGAFPAHHSVAHVVEEQAADEQRIFRVVVGAFLSRAEASRVRAGLAEELQTTGFVRAL